MVDSVVFGRKLAFDFVSGSPIIVDDYLIMSAEYPFKNEDYDALIITKNRYDYVVKKYDFIDKVENNKKFVSIALNYCGNFEIDHRTLSFIAGVYDEEVNEEEVIKIINNIGKCETFDISMDVQNALYDLAVYCESLPAFFVKKITEDEKMLFVNENKIFSVSSSVLENFISVSNDSLEFLFSAPLLLRGGKNSINADVKVFRSGYKEHYAIIIHGVESDNCDRDKEWEPLVRIHSSCVTGDLMRSLRCDCYDQLYSAIETIAQYKGGGILIYLNQEGRGIGLTNKLRTYHLQFCKDLDTVEANNAIGFSDDERIFDTAVNILKYLGVSKVKLLTNNKNKVSGIERDWLKVVEIIPHHIDCNENLNIKDYYKTKVDRLKHKIPIN